jgi:hypothetical protein
MTVLWHLCVCVCVCVRVACLLTVWLCETSVAPEPRKMEGASMICFTVILFYTAKDTV